MTRRTFLLAILLIAGWITTLGINAIADDSDPYKHFFSDSFGDFKDELNQARSEGKKAVMLFFEMDECPFCHRMKETVLSQPDVQSYFRDNFKAFAVDIEGDVEIKDFEGKATTQKNWAFDVHRVRATPVIAFFDLEGKKIMTYTGATRDKDEFLLMGKFVAEGHYKNTDFVRYKREQKSKSPAA